MNPAPQRKPSRPASDPLAQYRPSPEEWRRLTAWAKARGLMSEPKNALSIDALLVAKRKGLL